MCKTYTDTRTDNSYAQVKAESFVIDCTKELVPRGNIAILVIATSISGVSNVALSFLPIYFTSLGGTVLQYGIITTFATLVGIPSTVAGGVLAGRHALKKISIVASWITPAVIAGYYISNSWEVLSIPILVGAAGALGSTAWRQLVADATVHRSRTAQLSLYQTLTGLPSMFSPLLGGYLVHMMGTVDGFRDGALVSLAVSPISTILLVKFLRDKNERILQNEEHLPLGQKAKEPSTGQKVLSSSREFWSNLMRLPKELAPLLAAYVLVIIANSTTGPYMIFYATSIARLDTFQWGIILTLQLLFANLVRIPLGIASDRLDKKKVLFMSVICTAPLSTLLVFERSFFGILGVLLAMIATGVSYGPTHEALQIELTPRQKRHALFAIFDVLRTVSASAGTLVGGLLFTLDFALPFYGFTVLELCAGAIIGSMFFRRKSRYTVTPPH